MAQECSVFMQFQVENLATCLVFSNIHLHREEEEEEEELQQCGRGECAGDGGRCWFRVVSASSG